jgi:hypothetical protein
LQEFISLKLKELVDSWVARVTKKRGPQNEGKFHYVIENKLEKMPVCGLAKMLLKINYL